MMNIMLEINQILNLCRKKNRGTLWLNIKYRYTTNVEYINLKTFRNHSIFPTVPNKPGVINENKEWCTSSKWFSWYGK